MLDLKLVLDDIRLSMIFVYLYVSHRSARRRRKKLEETEKRKKLDDDNDDDDDGNEAKERDEHFSSSTYLYIHLLSFNAIRSRCCLIFPCRSSSRLSSLLFYFLCMCVPEMQSSEKKR